MFFIGRRRVDWRPRLSCPVRLAPTGVRAEPNLPWRHASGEPRAVLAVGNATGRAVCRSKPPLLPARPSRRSSRLHGSGGLKASIPSR